MRVLLAVFAVGALGAWKKNEPDLDLSAELGSAEMNISEEMPAVSLADDLAVSGRSQKIRYGDAISLKHMISDGAVSLKALSSARSMLISKRGGSRSYFRILHEDGTDQPASVVSRSSKVLLQELTTGKFVFPVRIKGGVFAKVSKGQSTTVIASSGDIANDRQMTWSIEQVMNSMKQDTGLSIGKNFMLRSVASNTYMHSDSMTDGYMRIDTKAGGDDGNSILVADSIIISNDVAKIPKTPAAFEMILEDRTVNYGDTVTLKNFVTETFVRVHVRTGGKAKEHARLVLKKDGNPATFRILHANGEAEPSSPVTEKSKVILQEANSGKLLFMGGNEKNPKLKLGMPEHLGDARFFIRGVFGSLAAQPLQTNTKFMLRNTKYTAYIKAKVSTENGKSLYTVSTTKEINGNSIFVVSGINSAGASSGSMKTDVPTVDNSSIDKLASVPEKELEVPVSPSDDLKKEDEQKMDSRPVFIEKIEENEDVHRE